MTRENGREHGLEQRLEMTANGFIEKARVEQRREWVREREPHSRPAHRGQAGGGTHFQSR